MATSESTLPYPPVHRDKRFVIFSDWDGTITTQDSNDYLTDNLGYGKEKRRAGNLKVLSGEASLRDEFKSMLESVSANGHSFETCKEAIRANIRVDSSFGDFYRWCKAEDIPVVIVSSGMAPIIRAVLSDVVGEADSKAIDIIANDASLERDGRWSIQYRHPTSAFGHDKSCAILPYRHLPVPPLTFFFGDGVSDMSAARHADVLFVKHKSGENYLAAYCEREKIRHVLFDDFSSALPIVRGIVNGELSVDQVLSAGKN